MLDRSYNTSSLKSNPLFFSNAVKSDNTSFLFEMASFVIIVGSLRSPSWILNVFLVSMISEIFFENLNSFWYKFRSAVLLIL